LVVTVAVGGVMIGSMHYALNIAFKDRFSRDKILSQMNLLNQQVPATILSQGEPNPIPLENGLTRVGRINQTGTIRVGFHPDNLPFSYYNARDELVGFDIDMAHRLARDAGLTKIELVPFAFPTLFEQLAEDHFDLAMSGIVSEPNLPEFAQPSVPYMIVTMALVVRDHDRNRFIDMDMFRHRKSIKIGVKTNSAFVKKVGEFLPNAKIVELWSESQFFEGPPEHMDALVTSAEVGSAWTLVHPHYAVVTPFPRQIKIPLVYLVALGEEQGEDWLQHWIELKKQDGTIEELYDYWILGRGTQVRKPRWSVIRDVLHWVD
jgi:ABC-type amino acid transport substrate-binding protein